MTASINLPFELNPQQVESILNFAKGNDVFACLPTGFGKTLCYILIPRLFDALHNVDDCSLMLVISPLIALSFERASSYKKIIGDFCSVCRYHHLHRKAASNAGVVSGFIYES